MGVIVVRIRFQVSGVWTGKKHLWNLSKNSKPVSKRFSLFKVKSKIPDSERGKAKILTTGATQ